MGYFRQTTRLQLSNFVEWSTEILFFNFPYLASMILKAYFNHQHHDEMNVKNVHGTEVIETRNAMFYREERLEVRSDQWYDWLIMNIFYIFVAKSWKAKKNYTHSFRVWFHLKMSTLNARPKRLKKKYTRFHTTNFLIFPAIVLKLCLDQKLGYIAKLSVS